MNDGVIINDAGKHDVNRLVARHRRDHKNASAAQSAMAGESARLAAGPARGHPRIHGIGPSVETEN